jgi:hypothetical protein
MARQPRTAPKGNTKPPPSNRAPQPAMTKETATRAGRRPSSGTRNSYRGSLLKKRNPLVYVGQVAALVGLIGSIVGLVFVFKPGWKPQPPPDAGRLEITTVGKPRIATFRRYLERVRVPTYDLTREYLGRRGRLIEFRYEAVGLRGKQLPIQWEVIDAKTHDRVVSDDETGDDETWNDAVGIEPSNNDEAAKWFVWVPDQAAGREYYVTVTIYQPRKGDVDVPLADFDTAVFRGFAIR